MDSADGSALAIDCCLNEETHPLFFLALHPVGAGFSYTQKTQVRWKPLASDEEVLMSQMPEFGDGEPDPHPVVENVVEEEAN